MSKHIGHNSRYEHKDFTGKDYERPDLHTQIFVSTPTHIITLLLLPKSGWYRVRCYVNILPLL